MEEIKRCTHLDKGIDVDTLRSRIRSTQLSTCEACRGSLTGSKKNLSEDSIDLKLQCKTIWICLKCGLFSCGGIENPVTPAGHAFRHAKVSGHPLVMKLEKLQLQWCFQCNTVIQIETKECSNNKDLVSNVEEVLKERPSQPSNMNERCRYVIRGLANLGNSCFLNSILQNLLTMNMLRDYFLGLEDSVGPLNISLKDLYIGTSPQACSTDTAYPTFLLDSVRQIAPKFGEMKQQDSHELLLVLLNGLHNEELSARKEKSSTGDGDSTNSGLTFAESVFQGEVSSTLSCVVCKKSSTVFETFFNLSLAVPSKKGDSIEYGSSPNVTEDSKLIDEDLDNRAERLLSGWLKYIDGTDEDFVGDDMPKLDDLVTSKDTLGDDMPKDDDVAIAKDSRGDDALKVDEVGAMKDPGHDDLLKVDDVAIVEDPGGDDVPKVDDIGKDTDSRDHDVLKVTLSLVKDSGGNNKAKEVGASSRVVYKPDQDEVDKSDTQVSIESCLDIFTKSEELSWQCEYCNQDTERDVDKTPKEVAEADDSIDNKGKVGCDSREMGIDNVKVKDNATKRILIYKSPPILIIHLKRFKQVDDSDLRKVSGHVVFKDILDLGPYMYRRCNNAEDEVKYRLIGVVEHRGSMKMGHYVAFVRGGCPNEMAKEGDQASDKWYCVDDATVFEVSSDEVLGCEAYILFYQKL